MFERLLARTYDRSINRLDLDRTMASWADDAVFEFPGHSTISGRFVGKPAIRAWWQRVFERASEVRFVPRHVAFANPFLLTFANTMFTELEVDITTKDGRTVHAELVSVVRFRRGKAVHARDYFLDPSVEEVLWGRIAEPLSSASITAPPSAAAVAA
jgi:ketosteroid isomerase-like protein